MDKDEKMSIKYGEILVAADLDSHLLKMLVLAPLKLTAHAADHCILQLL
jgi:hypothetical protein